jgi:hypothetical protein
MSVCGLWPFRVASCEIPRQLATRDETCRGRNLELVNKKSTTSLSICWSFYKTMNYFVVCSAKNKYHCSMRVCLFYWYCHCLFTSYIICNSRTDLWWCLYFHISSVWSLIKTVIFKFVLTAKLDSRFLAGCIQEVFCILCMSCEWKMWVCVCVLHDCIW